MPYQSVTQQEAEVESAYKDLKERHGEMWDMPRLKLWAWCIASGIHDDYDNPPDSPAFSGAAPKHTQKESLSEALSGTAVAIVKEIKKAGESPHAVTLPSWTWSISWSSSGFKNEEFSAIEFSSTTL